MPDPSEDHTAGETPTETDGVPSMTDHLRARANDPIDAGVYRVVGTDGETVTLLAVATAAGTRIHSGRLEHVDEDLATTLPPAPDPDAGWGRLRQVPAMYAAHPLLTATALAGALVGVAGKAAVLALAPDLANAALLGGLGVLAALSVAAVR